MAPKTPRLRSWGISLGALSFLAWCPCAFLAPTPRAHGSNHAPFSGAPAGRGRTVWRLQRRSELMEETRMLRETLGSLTKDWRKSGPEIGSEVPAAVAAPTPVPTAAPAAPVASAEKAVEAKVAPKAAKASPPPAASVGTTQLKVVSAGGDAGDIADFFVEEPDMDNVVLIALKDSGMENLDGEGLHALQSVGSTLENRLGFRQGYALIGVKDGEAMAERKGPMVMAEAKLKIAIRPPSTPIRA
eukprot:g27361.t1